MTHDHDHGGDRLGEDEPVESIDVNSVTMDQFDLPATYVVFPRGPNAIRYRWFAMRTDTQEIEFADDDGVKVINRALKRLGEIAPDADQKGLVRVTANVGTFEESEPTSAQRKTDISKYQLRSPTTIEHTTDGTALLIEPNFYHLPEERGVGESIRLAGDGIHLDFSIMETHGAAYGFRDLGLSNSTIRGGLFLHSSNGAEIGWLSDAENQMHPTPRDAGYNHLHFAWFYSNAGPAGIKMSSAPGARFENYRWRLPILFGGDTPVVFGDRSDADSVNHNVFAGDIDSASSGSSHLAEINDSHNGIYLKDYVPGSEHDDITIRPSAEDCFVLPLTAQGFPWSLFVRRESLSATDMSKFDPFNADAVSFELFPDSLAGYATERTGNGQVRLHSGHVEQATGEHPDSWANVHRRVSVNYDRLSFGHHGVLQTNVQVSDNAGQRAWLVWGDREGPGVGWRILDDRLEGFVHDGDAAETVPLRAGFDPGAAWNLTALYNPPSGVQYFVEDVATGRGSTVSDEDSGNPGDIDPSIDTRTEVEATVEVPGPVDAEASLSTTPTGERSTAYQIMAMDLTNTTPEEKALRWSTWRHHQYPAAQ